jgi:hypothetical protein
MRKVREILESNYAKLAITLLGPQNVPTSLSIQSPNTTGEPILTRAYYHNYLNEQGNPTNPSNINDIRTQQVPSALPRGEAHDVSISNLNANLLELIEKQKAEVMSRILGILRDSNLNYKNEALSDLDRSASIDELLRNKTVQEVKQRLRDYTGDANRNWKRVATTEISNAVGLGSADRIVAANKDRKDAEDIYVYKINPNDGATCKFCREFFIDTDGSPKVYKLSTLLSYGSNYGQKNINWKPTIGATHPNCRESQVLELRPGWKVLVDGSVTWIGLDKWYDEYIRNKVTE